MRGDLKSAESLGLQDLQDFYRREFTPGTSSLVVVGMVDFRPRGGGGRPALGRLDRAAARPARPTPRSPGSSAPRAFTSWTGPTSPRARSGWATWGCPASHPDFFAIKLMNYILGAGGFSSRLMSRIRSDLGFTYGIRSSFHFRRAPGPFIISTFTPAANTAAVVKEIAQVVKEVRDGGVSESELAEAQSYHVGHFPLGLETSRGIGNQVISMDLYDLGRDYLKRYCDQIRAVTLKTAAQAAQSISSRKTW